jgi:hypothetical protein
MSRLRIKSFTKWRENIRAMAWQSAEKTLGVIARSVSRDAAISKFLIFLTPRLLRFARKDGLEGLLISLRENEPATERIRQVLFGVLIQNFKAGILYACFARDSLPGSYPVRYMHDPPYRSASTAPAAVKA